MIQRLLADSKIRQCRLLRAEGELDTATVHGVESAPRPTASGLVIPGTTEARRANALAAGQVPEEEAEAAQGDDLLGAVIGIDRGKSTIFHFEEPILTAVAQS
jgi:hypothetical protein